MNARHDASHEHDTSPTGKPDVPKPAGGGILNLVLHLLLAWRPGGYLRASGSLFGWLLLRAAAQAAMVVLLARALGVEGYGLFVTALALSGFFSPIAGLGLGGLLLRDGAREPAALPRLLGMALKRQPHVAERLMMTMRGKEGRDECWDWRHNGCNGENSGTRGLRY